MSATLADYLDSTPELRGRRDRMLAIIEKIEDGRRHPHRAFADAQGIVRIQGHVNRFTGEDVTCSPPAEIHHDDVDWLMELWAEGDRLDYEIWLAGAS